MNAAIKYITETFYTILTVRIGTQPVYLSTHYNNLEAETCDRHVQFLFRLWVARLYNYVCLHHTSN